MMLHDVVFPVRLNLPIKNFFSVAVLELMDIAIACSVKGGLAFMCYCELQRDVENDCAVVNDGSEEKERTGERTRN